MSGGRGGDALFKCGQVEAAGHCEKHVMKVGKRTHNYISQPVRIITMCLFNVSDN